MSTKRKTQLCTIRKSNQVSVAGRGRPFSDDDEEHDDDRALDDVDEIIDEVEKHRGHIFHLTNETENNGISWYDFAIEIFKQKEKK